MSRRAWAAIAAVSLALVAVLAPTTTAEATPAAIPAAVAGHPASGAACQAMVETVDVSRWQGNIDWRQVADRYAGAWIKIAGGDGGFYRDGLATQNVLGATAAAMPWGTYYFAGVTSSGWEEADYAVSQGFGTGTLPPTLDLEINPRGFSSASLNQYALDFVNRVREKTGRLTIVYTGAYLGVGDGYLSAELAATAPLWIANYGANTPYNSPCNRSFPPVPDGWAGRGFAIWQHNSTSHIPGIAANSVDLNIVDPGQWAEWTGAGVEPNPNPSGTNDPAPADNVVWGPGSSGPKVRQIQSVVRVSVDGVYGPSTKAAVDRWQAALGLPADGYWGPQTEAATATFFTWLSTAPAAPLPVTRPTIRYGARGSDVRYLQSRLGVAADSIWGPRTQAAVVYFQRAHGLVADGIVGPLTWAAIG